MDLKAALTAVYAKYDTKERTFEFFERNQSRPELGVIFVDENSKKIALHEEKTPSTVCGKYLRYTNFGREGKQRDVIHLIMENNDLSFPDAVKMLLEWENHSLDAPIEKVKLTFEKEEKQKAYTEGYLDKMKKEATEYASEFNSILPGLFRSCSEEEILRGISIFNIGLNRFEGEEGMVSRLFIPEYDENGVAYGSFRYNRTLDPKGLLRKNCQRVIFGSHLLKVFDRKKPVIFAEGHSDTAVNNAKKFQTLTTGSSTTKIGDNISLLAGLHLHFYPDADIAGLKGVSMKIIEIETFNATATENDKITYEVFWWGETVFSSRSNSYFNKKDFVKEQIKIFKKEKFHAPENAKFKNWRILKKGIVKEGFDFIDFHTENSDSPKYDIWMKKYLY